MAVRGCAGARAGRRLPESRLAPGRGGQTAWAAPRIPVAPGRVRDTRGEPLEGAGRAGYRDQGKE